MKAYLGDKCCEDTKPKECQETSDNYMKAYLGDKCCEDTKPKECHTTPDPYVTIIDDKCCEDTKPKECYEILDTYITNLDDKCCEDTKPEECYEIPDTYAINIDDKWCEDTNKLTEYNSKLSFLKKKQILEDAKQTEMMLLGDICIINFENFQKYEKYSTKNIAFTALFDFMHKCCRNVLLINNAIEQCLNIILELNKLSNIVNMVKSIICNMRETLLKIECSTTNLEQKCCLKGQFNSMLLEIGELLKTKKWIDEEILVDNKLFCIKHLPFNSKKIWKIYKIDCFGYFKDLNLKTYSEESIKYGFLSINNALSISDRELSLILVVLNRICTFQKFLDNEKENYSLLLESRKEKARNQLEKRICNYEKSIEHLKLFLDLSK